MPHILSIIANPARVPLTEEALAIICAALNSAGLQTGEGRWLSPGEAWEADLAVVSEGTDQLIAELREDWPFDINIVSAENRLKRLLIADMDSTVIGQECIDELAEVAGVGDEVRAVTAIAMRGEMDFPEAMRQRVARIRGLPATAISNVIENRLTFTPGGRQLVHTMHQAGAFTALISGGFTQFTEHVAEVVGFKAHQANELLFEDGRLTGEIREPVLGQSSKVEALNRFCTELGLTPDDALTVGDGANDIAMLRAAGLGVALHAKPAVREAAGCVIDHGDLTALLYLQGYERANFVLS